MKQDHGDMTTESRTEDSDIRGTEHGGYPSWIFDDPRWIIDPEYGMP